MLAEAAPRSKQEAEYCPRGQSRHQMPGEKKKEKSCGTVCLAAFEREDRRLDQIT